MKKRKAKAVISVFLDKKNPPAAGRRPVFSLFYENTAYFRRQQQMPLSRVFSVWLNSK
ncbi:hypothetical protein [Candidatus Electronema sp. TJ]|uniref:hypothetical protein n=1 Tax=Candidatus Electronema sp. TJ TaxID=3401573 RepID=UPI003AA97638